ncbi:MAG: V4R domain-containing protein [Methanobacteriaceae archaeon]|jgi:predicted hydrocarbon binding protein
MLLYEKIVKSFEKEGVRKISGNTVSAKLYRLLPSFVEWERGSGLSLYGFGKFLGKDIGKYLVKEKSVNDVESLSKATVNLFGPDDWNVGITEIKELWDAGFIITIKENATCVGIKPTGHPFCIFETGILAGLAEGALNRSAQCIESSCLVAGDDDCEFVVELKSTMERFW